MNKIFEGKKIKKEGTMPIYVFRCEECGEIFEVFILRSDEEEEIKCPKCGSKSYKRNSFFWNFRNWWLWRHEVYMSLKN